MANPIAWLIRHGDDGENPFYVSWTDLSLSAKGKKQAKAAAKFLADKNIKYVFSSPLERCILMAAELDMPITQDRGLLPWNRGILTGIPDDEDSRAALQLFIENPTVKIPLGESRRDCENRLEAFYVPALKLAEDERCAFFTHHSNIDVLNCLLLGKRNEEPYNLVEKGGIAAVYADDDSYRLEPVLNPSEESEHFS